MAHLWLARRLRCVGGLAYVDLTWVTGIEVGKVLSEARALELSRQSCAAVTAFIVSDKGNIVPEDPVESLAASLHEPNFEASIGWQRVKQRLNLAFPVVRSKDRLAKLFLVKIGVGHIESSEAVSTLSVY